MRTISCLFLAAVAAIALPAQAGAAITSEFIVGGKTAADGAWPWQVRLLEVANVNAGSCGGSFVTEQWVLTAAHCLVETVDGQLVTRPQPLFIGYGSTYQSKLTIADVEAVFVHPEYFHDDSHDIGLVKLAAPVPDAEWIEVATPEREAQLTSPGAPLIVTGWGAIWDFKGFEESGELRGGREMVSPGLLLSSNDLQSPDQLHEVEIVLIDGRECDEAYRAFGEAVGTDAFFVSSNQMCAGVPEGAKDSCYGDSGGPLVAPADNAQGYIQVGIVNWGVQCGNPALPGVYNRTSQFYDWIRDTVLAH
jgi:secreted trypsin-like serine protease